MERSISEVEAVMKPVLLSAGIPLAITVVGFVFTRIASRKSCIPTEPSSESQENSQQIDSCGIIRDEDSFQCLNSEIYQEWQMESRFLDYDHELKGQELELIELQNKLLFEINRVEILEKEISLLEAEKQRFKSMEYFKVIGPLVSSRSENEMLHKRIKKLLRKTKNKSIILRKQSFQIEAKEAEISQHQKQLLKKTDCIKKMRDEIRELAEESRMEKNELSNKLRTAEELATSKSEEEIVTVEDFNKLSYKVEKLQKEVQSAEVKELTRLRWCNAWLNAHEQMGRNQEKEEREEMKLKLGGTEEIGIDNEHNNSTTGGNDGVQSGSKRRKLIARFKRWMQGNEKFEKNCDEKEKREKYTSCFGKKDESLPY